MVMLVVPARRARAQDRGVEDLVRRLLSPLDMKNSRAILHAFVLVAFACAQVTPGSPQDGKADDLSRSHHDEVRGCQIHFELELEDPAIPALEAVLAWEECLFHANDRSILVLDHHLEEVFSPLDPRTRFEEWRERSGDICRRLVDMTGVPDPHRTLAIVDCHGAQELALARLIGAYVDFGLAAPPILIEERRDGLEACYEERDRNVNVLTTPAEQVEIEFALSDCILLELLGRLAMSGPSAVATNVALAGYDLCEVLVDASDRREEYDGRGERPKVLYDATCNADVGVLLHELLDRSLH
jgi:hypothetical protein